MATQIQNSSLAAQSMIRFNVEVASLPSSDGLNIFPFPMIDDISTIPPGLSHYNHYKSGQGLYLGDIRLLLRLKTEEASEYAVSNKESLGRALSAEIPAICLVHAPRQDPCTRVTITKMTLKSLPSSLTRLNSSECFNF